MKWRIDWDRRIIFLSQKMTNKDIVGMLMHMTGDEVKRMVEDGPNAEWTIIVTTEQN